MATTELSQYAALVGSTSGCAVGVALGWSSLGSQALQSAVGWELKDADFVISSLGIGAGIGAILAIGLPRSLRLGALVCAPLLITGWTIICLNEYEYYRLLAGRILIGLGIGALSVITPLYIAEISDTKYREISLCYFHMMLSGGIGCSYLVAYTTTSDNDDVVPLKRYSLGCACVSVPAIVCIAAPNLKTSWKFESVDQAVGDIKREFQESGKMLKNPRFWRAFGIVASLMICHQMSGAIPVIFNVLTLIDFSGSAELTSNEMSLICAAVLIVTSVLAAGLVKIVGRKLLLFVSSLLMGISLLLIGVFMVANSKNSDLGDTYYWLSPSLLSLYFGSYSFGLGPIVWSLIGDSFPLELKVPAASLIVSSGWFATFLINYYLRKWLEELNMPGTLWLFAGFCALGSVLSLIFVSKSKDKSLLDIQEEFQMR